MAVSVAINFQPAGPPTPSGFIADQGAVYGDRGVGFSYGWNLAVDAHTRDRNSPASPSQAYDTLVHTQKVGAANAAWEMAVPNGAYRVHLVAGDPSFFNSVYRFNAEGNLLLAGAPTSSKRWIEAAGTVQVSDGRLTISNASGASNNKLAFIRVTSAETGTGAAAVTVVATDPTGSEDGADRARFKFTRTGSTSERLVVRYAIGGTAVNGQDFVTLGTNVVIPAGRASAEVAIKGIDDSFDGPDTTVTLTLAGATGYEVGSPASATIKLLDDDGGAPAANRRPATPRIIDPGAEGDLVNAFDVHMETAAFIDPDGDAHASSDFELWTTSGTPRRVWSARGVTEGGEKTHIHFADGEFEGPQAGKTRLEFDTAYQVRVRHRDDSGAAATEWSDWARRNFRTEKQIISVPQAPNWTADQAGYKVEALPLKLAAGEPGLKLALNIAFVPNPGDGPGDPLFYVNELYGGIRVVSNDFTVRTYASNLLNYTPNGQFPGSGEQGLTGMCIDPQTGDLYVTMLYKKDPTAAVSPSYGRVTRLRSADGGRTMSQRTDILNMAGEYSAYSHQIANVSIGPDRKLYVQNGDAVIPKDALNLDSWRGKIFRVNLDGSAPSDNPFYNSGNGINARDYVYASGLRNPFGGAWRSSDQSLYFVENGPNSNDRLAKARRGASYGWNGEATSLKTNAVYNWSSTTAPVNIAFIQNSSFGGSNFPANKLNHAFVTESGPTYATGPQTRGKKIREFTIDSTGKLVGAPTVLARYTGNGKETAAGIAAGPDGLYFTSLYRDDPINGASSATHRGANIYRIRYVGT